jgi:hypothetical protein
MHVMGMRFGHSSPVSDLFSMFSTYVRFTNILHYDIRTLCKIDDGFCIYSADGNLYRAFQDRYHGFRQSYRIPTR